MKRDFPEQSPNYATPGATRRFRSARMAAMAGLGIAILWSGQTARAADFSITVDAGKSVSGNPHFWSACVGTGTASLTLRPDLQTHYKLGNRELGFERVRGHGVLNDDMGIYKAAGSYDWSKYDTYLDAIKAANMVPLMELSFMPKALASSGNDRNPPKDYTAYTNFIKAVVQHTVEKVGKEEVSKWYWEVWNEWNYSGFWTGTMEDYHKMYAAAVAGATAALPDILIGGPVTTQGSTSQMTSFLNYTKTNNLRVTFLSSHAYCGGEQATADASFAVSDNDGRVGVITKAGYTTDQIPSFNTEWNSSYSGQGGSTAANVMSMDTHANAPFIIKTVKLLADKTVGDKPAAPIFSYWAMSDVFDESSGPSGSYILGKTPNGTLPFGSVFGLTTFQGVRKAAFNGFKMLNYLGEKRLGVTGGTGTKDGVDAIAAVSANGSQVQIIVYNYYATVLTTGTDNVTVTVDNLPFEGKEAYITRFAIDEKNANPYSVWVSQNKPSAPTEAQWQAMRKAQHLMPVEDITKKTMESKYTATFAIPKQGAAMIILSLKRPLTGRDAKVEIEGEDYDGQSGITKEDSGDESMGQAISAAANGWVYFENVDYTDEGVDTVQLRVKNAAETSVELRSESETGTSLGKCTLPASSSWATQTCKLSEPVTGVSKLYLVFSGATRLNWLKFSGAGGTPTGGTGGNSGTGAGGSSGAGGTGGGKGGSTGAGGGGSTGSGSGGNGGSGGSKSGGTSGGAGQSSAGSSGGSSSSSSKPSGGSSAKSSSSASSSSSGGKSASSSSSKSSGSGGSSGQDSSGSASTEAGGSSSGCSCRVGGNGRGSQGTLSLMGLLLGVLALGRRRHVARASRAFIALLATVCLSACGSEGSSSKCQNGSCAGANGGQTAQTSGGAGGASSAEESSSSKASSASTKDSGGASGKAGSSGKGGSAGGGGGAGSAGAGGGGGKGGSTGGGTAGAGGGGKGGNGGSGGHAGQGGTTSGTAGQGGTTSGTAGQGGTTSGTAGQGGTASSSTGTPPPTLSLVTTKTGAEWKTDGQLKEVTTGNADITVNDGSPAQEWEGFGAAFNEKGWYYLSMLSEDDRNKALNMLFSADGVNFAWGRIPMGASDYAMDRYTCNETKDDTSMSKFSIDRDKEKLIPFVNAAKAIKTDMRFWASPWTPPTWLKNGPFNDDFPDDGGKMKTDATSLKALADYFVKFVQAYGEEKINIEMVSPQNEPGYSGTYPTCGWDPTAYASFVGKHLGPALSAANLSVKIMLGTFNGGTGDTDIVKAVMGDTTAKPLIKVLGYQWGMDPSGAKSYGVPIWQTEHKCGNYPWETYNDKKAPNDQAYAVESWGLIRDWIKKGVTSYSTWNVVLDTIGLGNDSKRIWPQNALLTVDEAAKKLVITPTYYVFRHFSQFVKPGAKVVGTTGGDAVAFKNPDGSIVTVAYNAGAEKTMTVAAAGKKLQFTMPAAGWATVIARQ